jgi:hypothetical protein
MELAVTAVAVAVEPSPITMTLSPTLMSATAPLTTLVTVVFDDVSTATVDVAPLRSVVLTEIVEPSTFVTVPRAPPPNPLAPAGGVAPFAAAALVVTLDDFDPPLFETTTMPITTTTAVATPATSQDRQPDPLEGGGGLSVGGSSGSPASGSID